MGYAAPGIILAGQQPQPVSPLANLSQVLQAKDTLSQIGQRQALQQNIQAEADQRNRDLADQNTIQESMRDPDQWARINTGDLSGLAGKIQPKTLDSVQAAILANHQKLLTNTAEQNTIREKALGEINNTITGLRSLPPKADGTPDVDRINAALPGAISRLNDAGYFKQAGIDPSKLPQQITDPQQLETTQALLGGELAAHETIAKQQSEAATLAKTKAETGEAKSKGVESEAAAAKSGAETQQINRKVAMYDQLKANPGGLGQYVAGSIDPHKYPQEYAAAMNEAQHATDLDKLNEVISKHSQNISELNKSIATVQAEAPTRIAEATAIARANQAGMMGNQQVSEANKQAEKSYQDFGNRQAVASQVQKVLDAANSGDPVSAAAAPQLVQGLVNTVNGIKRQNPQFVDEMGPEAGSLFTRLEGSLKGGATGVKLTSDQIQNLGNFNALMSQGAQQKHVNELNAVNQVYGKYLAKPFEPTKAAPTPLTATNPTTHHQIKSLDNGKTWVDAKTGAPL